jgi:hypothetical protein
MVRALRDPEQFDRWAGPAPQTVDSADVAAVKGAAAAAKDLRDRVPLGYKSLKGGGMVTWRGRF